MYEVRYCGSRDEDPYQGQGYQSLRSRPRSRIFISNVLRRRRDRGQGLRGQGVDQLALLITGGAMAILRRQ
jgi:hypothetical protein